MVGVLGNTELNICSNTIPYICVCVCVCVCMYVYI